MCGLTGILIPKDLVTDRLSFLLKKLIVALVNRGPDSKWILLEGGIALGHRRQSIIVVSLAGAQPVHSACGRYVIVFNGEIYNHLDLRHDLGAELAAHDWRVYPDSEMLHAGIAHWVPRDKHQQPFADSAQVPTNMVCKAARSDVTVALSSSAGDEQVGGYNCCYWVLSIWLRVYCMMHQMRHVSGRAIAELSVAAWDRICTQTNGSVNRPGDKAHRLFAWLCNVRMTHDFFGSLVSKWSGELMFSGLGGESHTVVNDLLPTSLADDTVARMRVQDMRSYLPNDILCTVVLVALAISLEIRVPFLDPEVLAASARLQTG